MLLRLVEALLKRHARTINEKIPPAEAGQVQVVQNATYKNDKDTVCY